MPDTSVILLCLPSPKNSRKKKQLDWLNSKGKDKNNRLAWLFKDKNTQPKLPVRGCYFPHRINSSSISPLSQ